ncbi:MAG: hypothetical protein JWP95_1231 [Actinotalea sp.]|nr:hypothetical protein [Actinotalea sp.]
MRTQRLTRTAVPPLALAALLLTGCSATGTGDETPEPSASAATEPSPSTEPGDSADETDGASASGAGPECLEGEWVSDLGATRELKLSAPGLEDLDPTAEVTGTSRVTFDGSTMTTEYEEQVTELTLTVEGLEVVVTTTLDGTVSAAYTATESEIDVSEVDIEGLTVETTATAGGADTELPVDQDIETFGVDLSGVSDYTCDDQALEITPQTEGVGSFTQVLTRD